MTGGKARSWSRPKSRRCTAKRRMAANIRLKRVSAKSAGLVKKGAWGLGYGIGFGAVQSGVGLGMPLVYQSGTQLDPVLQYDGSPASPQAIKSTSRPEP